MTSLKEITQAGKDTDRTKGSKIYVSLGENYYQKLLLHYFIILHTTIKILKESSLAAFVIDGFPKRFPGGDLCIYQYSYRATQLK